ncbi:MAG: bifunctional GNAT family N-acetyltransferase/(deoxy)nucleoside triphosphate pyrophosphohydrolase [Alphaproteobacteria bacterium]
MAATEAEGGAATGLTTARLVLRHPVEGDAPAIEALAGEWEVARWTQRIPHPYPPGGALRFLAEVAADRADGSAEVFAITRRDDGAFIGNVGLERGDEPGEYEVGYWLGRPHWGRGYATEAVRAALRHAFADPDTRLVFAEIHPDNAASRRVLEKAGMRETGRVATRIRGEPVETIRFEATPPQPLPTLLVAAVALIDADGRVLIAERPPGKAMAGLWEFPGGKVAPGETPEEALVRELAEELGIDTAVRCLAPIAFASHRYETFHLLMPLFACRNWRGTPTPYEGQRLAWVRAQRLGDYAMPPADAPLVAVLRDLL